MRPLVWAIIWPRKSSDYSHLRGCERRRNRATFVAVKKNLLPNKMLMAAKTTKSDAFFRFTVVARAGLLSSPANSDQWHQRPGTICQRCDEHTVPMVAHIFKSCPANHSEMTTRHNKVVTVANCRIDNQQDTLSISREQDNARRRAVRRDAKIEPRSEFNCRYT
jgi:hypothetical protein